MNGIVKFNGSEIQTVEKDGEVYVAMKPVVEAMGLEWSRQIRMIKKDAVLSATMVKLTMVAEDGKQREMTGLPLEYLNGWLFKINANRYNDERRDLIMKYQRECYKVLFDYWNNGGAINEHATLEQLEIMQGQIIAMQKRIIAVEKENTEYRLLEEFYGKPTGFGEVSKKTGKIKTKPVRGYCRTDNKDVISIPVETLQLLLNLKC